MFSIGMAALYTFLIKAYNAEQLAPLSMVKLFVHANLCHKNFLMKTGEGAETFALPDNWQDIHQFKYYARREQNFNEDSENYTSYQITDDTPWVEYTVIYTYFHTPNTIDVRFIVCIAPAILTIILEWRCYVFFSHLQCWQLNIETNLFFNGNVASSAEINARALMADSLKFQRVIAERKKQM